MSALIRLGLASGKAEKDYTPDQEQTRKAFSFKWSLQDTYESEAFQEASRQWLLERYCRGDAGEADRWLAGGRKIILDAGCGVGYSALLLFGERLKDHDYLGVDISDAVDIARERFAQKGCGGDFLQMDILDLPIDDGSVDMIFSEGVLHHTDSTEKSLKFLARKLKKGGRFLFYVYAKKSVIREFTDDYIREYLRPLSDEEAWKELEPLTRLGVELGKLQVQVEVPEDIPCLGIKKGTMDLQRFFYWNICKMYYRPEFRFEEMNHINFDWFRPLCCHRQTPEEIRAWCGDAGLDIEHMNIQEAGITVVAVRNT